MLRNVGKFDLVNDTELCPIERNALGEFYISSKGAEWTDSTNWLNECGNYCDWHGVTCDEGHMTNLNLTNNGLSGRLSGSIGKLASIKVLDLSDNDIKVMSIDAMHCICFIFIYANVCQTTLLFSHSSQLNEQGSIPTEIDLLFNLKLLRLSYNAFTGTAPEGLGELELQLLQLQSNRITGISDALKVSDIEYGNSSFVTDCGVPSAFDKPLNCANCTMCCE